MMVVEKEHAGGCVDTAGFRLGASFALISFKETPPLSQPFHTTLLPSLV